MVVSLVNMLQTDGLAYSDSITINEKNQPENDSAVFGSTGHQVSYTSLS
ncbi:hypothetical protein V202x_51620 [Gimesia aquarii]|uniref:Uncharacterized protein n=1 Tax=Gimesia aquarii TaxID=2527964 RepID=A0A517X2K8_9PLAN|nr:hypothetical protein V202x_51620 [Gimesia aquarii]